MERSSPASSNVPDSRSRSGRGVAIVHVSCTHAGMRGSSGGALEVEVVPLAALERETDERPAPDAGGDNNRLGVQLVQRAHFHACADLDARLGRGPADDLDKRLRVDTALVWVTHGAFDRAGERRLERARLLCVEHREPQP